MSFLPRYLLVAIFGAALLGGVQVPNFVTQYAQQVGARLQQVEQDLAGFRQIAQRYFHGSMDALVAAHEASADPRFRAEAAPLRQMVESEQALKAQQAGLSGSVYQQSLYVALHGDPALLDATWAHYAPAFQLNRDALVIGAGLAFGLCFLIEILFVCLRGGWRTLQRRRVPAA